MGVAKIVAGILIAFFIIVVIIAIGLVAYSNVYEEKMKAAKDVHYAGAATANYDQKFKYYVRENGCLAYPKDGSGIVKFECPTKILPYGKE